MTDGTASGPDYTAALTAIAQAIDAASTAHGTAMAIHGAKVQALTAAVTTQGQSARAGLDLIAAQLASIRHCVCDRTSGPETRAMRQLALRFGALPASQKWGKYEELLAVEVAAEAVADA